MQAFAASTLAQPHSGLEAWWICPVFWSVAVASLVGAGSWPLWALLAAGAGLLWGFTVPSTQGRTHLAVCSS